MPGRPADGVGPAGDCTDAVRDCGNSSGVESDPSAAKELGVGRGRNGVSYNESDTTGKADGLMRGTASEAVVLLHRQSGMSNAVVVGSDLDNRTRFGASHRVQGQLVRDSR
jgi:hypothetical protein